MRPLIHIVADIFVTPFEYFAFSFAIIALACVPAIVIMYRTHKALQRVEADIQADARAEYRAYHARHGKTI